jgi:hypothetical protein
MTSENQLSAIKNVPADVTTANASDLATAITLANALKVAVNSLLAQVRRMQ